MLEYLAAALMQLIPGAYARQIDAVAHAWRFLSWAAYGTEQASAAGMRESDLCKAACRYALHIAP